MKSPKVGDIFYSDGNNHCIYLIKSFTSNNGLLRRGDIKTGDQVEIADIQENGTAGESWSESWGEEFHVPKDISDFPYSSQQDLFKKWLIKNSKDEITKRMIQIGYDYNEIQKPSQKIENQN